MIILANNKELIVRRSVIKNEAVMAIQWLGEARFKKQLNGVPRWSPVPEIVTDVFDE